LAFTFLLNFCVVDKNNDLEVKEWSRKQCWNVFRKADGWNTHTWLWWAMFTHKPHATSFAFYHHLQKQKHAVMTLHYMVAFCDISDHNPEKKLS